MFEPLPIRSFGFLVWPDLMPHFTGMNWGSL